MARGTPREVAFDIWDKGTSSLAIASSLCLKSMREATTPGASRGTQATHFKCGVFGEIPIQSNHNELLLGKFRVTIDVIFKSKSPKLRHIVQTPNNFQIHLLSKILSLELQERRIRMKLELGLKDQGFIIKIRSFSQLRNGIPSSMDSFHPWSPFKTTI